MIAPLINSAAGVDSIPSVSNRLVQRWNGFVGGQDPFSAGNQTLSNALEILPRHADPPIVFSWPWNTHRSPKNF
jgi:hypothetical protein